MTNDIPPPGATRAPRLSLRTFVSRRIGLCVLPPLLLMVGIAVYHVRFLHREYERDALDRTRTVATAVDHHLAAQIDTLQVLAESPLLDDPSRFADFYRQAQSYHATMGGHVILADLSTRMLLNTRTPFGTALSKLPQPKGHAAVPAVLATGQPAVGDTFFGPLAGEELFAVVVPVVRHAQTQYLLLSVIETRHLQQHLDEVSLPAGWGLSVRDGKGEILTQRGARDEGSLAGTEPPRHFSTRSLKSHWSVVLEISRDVYHAPMNAAALSLATAILVATLLSVMVGRKSARQLAAAVAELAEADPSAASSLRIKEIETVRRRLEQSAIKLRENEARYRELFKANPHPMWVYDLETLAFLAVNNAAVAAYGYSRAEFLAMTIRDIRPGEQLPALDDSVHRDAGPMRRVGVWTHRWKDGTLRQVEIVTHDLDFDGRPARLVLANDATERLAAEEAICRLNAELEQKVEERTRDLEETATELEATNESLRAEVEERLRIEESLLAATVKLEAKNAELERINRLFVGRELRMRELKERLVALQGIPSAETESHDTGNREGT